MISFPQTASAVMFTACWLLSVFWVWSLHRQWWKLPLIRRLLWTVPLVELVLLVLWVIFARSGIAGTAIVLSVAVITLGVFSIALAISLPFSGIVLSVERLVRWWHDRRKRARDARSPAPAAVAVEPLPVIASRRSFISTAAAIIPGATVASAGYGVISSYGPVRFPQVPLDYPDLPSGLEGIRILHLSDIHLGPYVGLDDLEQALLHAREQRPDIVLVTGDVADDLRMLPEALRMIDELKPRYGTYASLGNHEYYRGIGQVRRDFDKGPIPLMVNQGIAVNVGSSTLYLSAADDPARVRGGLRGDNKEFLNRSIAAATDGAPSDAFQLLMSHRPEGFDVAADERLHLTVSGHYHGGIQMGWNGRAIIQPFAPHKYFWGHYRKGDSQLFTSGGVGHWLPFRLNCPPEAPVYVLRRA